jgi:hypothetical protein
MIDVITAFVCLSISISQMAGQWQGQLADGIAERQKVSANIKNLFTFSFDSQYILASIERKARITIKY